MAEPTEPSIEEVVRRCVREELERSGRNTNNATRTLVERTRNLIHASASSAAIDIGSRDVSRPHVVQPQAQPSTKRSAPGHALRFKKRSKGSEMPKVTIVPKSVYLLDHPGEIEDDQYSLTDDMVLIKGECDLQSDYNEDKIRTELTTLFKTKLPLIVKKDFEFVKRERNTIVKPLVKSNHEWDFKHVKHLAGAGRLYVRLNILKETLVPENSESSDEDLPNNSGISIDGSSVFSGSMASTSSGRASTTCRKASTSGDKASTFSGKSSTSGGKASISGGKASTCSGKTSTSGGKASIFSGKASTFSGRASTSGSMASTSNSMASTSSGGVSIYGGRESTSSIMASTSGGISYIDSAVGTLSALYPDADCQLVREVVVLHDSIEHAADALSKVINKEDNAVEVDECVNDILTKLKKKMKPFSFAEKLKVEADDLIMDFLHHYKNPEFDPLIPVKVQIKKQSAIDSGGVLRQAFSTLFSSLVCNEGGLKLFAGPPDRVTPIYSCENILSGIFEVLGKMISHSLVQGGPGFPFLAPAIYWYLATGELGDAVTRVSYIDVVDSEVAGFIAKIKSGECQDIIEVSNDVVFIGLLEQCGENRILTVQNKHEIVQSLILHNTIVKHKAALDQLRKGLSTLGLLQEIEKEPLKFEGLFVHHEGEVNADFIKKLLKFHDSDNPHVQEISKMLLVFLDKATEDELKSFLFFVTGCKSSTAVFKPGSIEVTIEDAQGIYASTCLLNLKLPSRFCTCTYEEFESSIKAAISGTTFTTV